MQMKIRKSFILLFSAVIAVLLLACAFMLAPKTTAHADTENVAQVVDSGGTTRFLSVEEAWNFANNLSPSTVTLLADVETTDTLTVESGKNITLDLNGHNITGDGTDSVITVNENASFTLCDCQETGIITGGNMIRGGGVYVDGTFKMTGGTISGNTGENPNVSSCGGGVYVKGTFEMTGGTISENTAINGGGVYVYAGGTFTMTGGTISGNTAINGGGVCVDGDSFSMSEGGTFIMSNGEISGNTAINGGGVCVGKTGAFTMTGGEISENEAFDEDLAARGGGIFVNYNGTFIMENGTVSGNTAKDGGGGLCIGFGGANVSVSGTPNITGNKVVMDGNDVTNNVYMLDGEITVTGELTEGAQIGVSNTGAVATGFTQEGDPKDFFIPDDPANNCVYVSDGTVNIGTHVWNDGEVTTPPTCADEGVKTITCTGCGETKTEPVEALGHTLTHNEATAATEEKDGNIEYWSCEVCDKYFEDAAGENEITDKTSVTLPKLTPAPTEETKSYWWLFLLLIPLAIGVGGVMLGIYVYKKDKENNK